MGERRALQLALWVALGALFVLVLPFSAPLVLAAWLAAALRPWSSRLAEVLGGKRRAAGIVTVLALVVIVAPLGAIVASLALDATQLGRRLAASSSGRDALAQLVSSDEDAAPGSLDWPAMLAMAERYGSRALDLAGSIADIGGALAIGVFVFFSAAYFFLVEGPAGWAWVRQHAPVDGRHLERLRGAFMETGRGLFVGIGLTGLVQAGIATIAYIALGVPRALVLGAATLLASILPTIGTALVWLPITVALAVTGRTTAALVLAVVGVVVVGGIDNVLRPLFTRSGRLALHPFVLLMAMLGGLALFGASGLFLGPLIARLAVEIVRMAEERGLVGTSEPRPRAA